MALCLAVLRFLRLHAVALTKLGNGLGLDLADSVARNPEIGSDLANG
jgi:hypothetical protein